MYLTNICSRSSEAILYRTGRRLVCLFIVTTYLHGLILFFVDFKPLIDAMQQLRGPFQKAVSITLDKTSPPEIAHYLGLVDHQGPLKGESAEPSRQVLSFPSLLPTPMSSFVGVNDPRVQQSTQKILEPVMSAEYTAHVVSDVIPVASHQDDGAPYLYRWQQYVEAIGSELYPREALEKNITGQLKLLVAIAKDGYIKKMMIRQSSGVALLDQAAMNIIKQAQPFEPVPQAMLGENEMIEIIRTWDFRGQLKLPS